MYYNTKAINIRNNNIFYDKSQDTIYSLKANVHQVYSSLKNYTGIHVYFFRVKYIVMYIFFLLAHGTHIGHIRLESRKPQQVPIDSEIHFGASTRLYIIRERPQAITGQISDDNDNRREDLEGGLLGLPETETELDVNSIIHVLNMQNCHLPQTRIFNLIYSLTYFFWFT